MSNELAAFDVSDEDVYMAAKSVGIEMSLDEADAYFNGLPKTDLVEAAKAALNCDGGMDARTKAAQQKLAEFLVRDGHAARLRM